MEEITGYGMSGHKCVIGLLRLSDCSELVTVDSLVKIIRQHIESDNFQEYGSLSKFGDVWFRPYSMNDYGDKRKRTNLTRFEYCPNCGSKIGWMFIRKIDVMTYPKIGDGDNANE